MSAALPQADPGQLGTLRLLARTFRYPGAPYLLPASPWRLSRRAPKLGEHDDEILK